MTKPRGNLVPIHPDNVKTKDWVVLLEAATIVGHARDKLRVALTTQERNLVKKRHLFRKPEYFLVVDGYDPRIHALYFCPQLYKNEDGELLPLSGQEIGQLIVASPGGRGDRKVALVRAIGQPARTTHYYHLDPDGVSIAWSWTP